MHMWVWILCHGLDFLSPCASADKNFLTVAQRIELLRAKVSKKQSGFCIIGSSDFGLYWSHRRESKAESRKDCW